MEKLLTCYRCGQPNGTLTRVSPKNSKRLYAHYMGRCKPVRPLLVETNGVIIDWDSVKRVMEKHLRT